MSTIIPMPMFNTKDKKGTLAQILAVELDEVWRAPSRVLVLRVVNDLPRIEWRAYREYFS